MKQQIYLLIALALFVSLFSVIGNVSAQNLDSATTQNESNSNINTSTTAADTQEDNQNITASDLGITEPKILPDSPWYGLKRFWEGIYDTFTFNPIVKAENSLTRASERLIEIQKLIDQGKIKNADQAISRYQNQIDKVKERIDKLSDVQSEKATKFLDKFAEYQIKHRLVLEKIEESSENPDAVKIAKEKALGVLSDALSKTNNEEIQARIENAMAMIEDGDLKQFKNLEILKALEDKVPENAKPAILKAQVNALKRLKEDINKLPNGLQSDKIEKFLEKNKGDNSKYLEILDELMANDNLPPEVINNLPSLRLILQERIRNEQETEDQNDDINEAEDQNDDINEAEDQNDDQSDSSDNENGNENGNGNQNREREGRR